MKRNWNRNKNRGRKQRNKKWNDKNVKNGNRKRNKTGIRSVARYKTEQDWNSGWISYINRYSGRIRKIIMSRNGYRIMNRKRNRKRNSEKLD
jgi:hypothetical protein